MTELQEGRDIFKFMELLNVPKIKGKGNETGIESVQSHQKTSDLIEKQIRHFFCKSVKNPRSISRYPAAEPNRERISRSFTGRLNSCT